MSPHGRIPKILNLKYQNELEEYLSTSSYDGYEETNIKNVLESNGFDFDDESLEEEEE